MEHETEISKARKLLLEEGVDGARQRFRETLDPTIVQAITDDLNRRADEFNKKQRDLKSRRSISRLSASAAKRY